DNPHPTHGHRRAGPGGDPGGPGVRQPFRADSRAGRSEPRQQGRSRIVSARQSSVLQVRDLAVEVGGRYTLTGASLTLRAGDKVGLVGRNGVGKTSLLKVLAGDAPAAQGV